MNTSEQLAYNEILKLVSDFKANEQYYLSSAYQEKEVRSDFIDKFFIALGWDVLHNEQKSPYAQEVKLEKGVEVSGAQKRADYSFSLAPNFRVPKFFVEAKKPSLDLYNADYYFQTIRYGWHQNTPLAVLTDFKQFHILDCRFEPDINTILNRKIKQYHYSDYTVQEKFAEIYWLFSREAVADNSLVDYVKGLPKLKGKAARKALLSSDSQFKIDEAFLIEIDGIREKLAKAFKKNDDSLNSEELTEATQRTIDRLVFIRFLEDKEIEQKHYVYEFGVKGTAWHDFIALCKKLDVKYNGIVFKKIFIDADTFKGPVDSEFYSICQGICHLKSRFLYNEIPIHILGSIYERFLGKVVNATAQRVKIEEKPEVRKAGGVYYTPKYIVDYIVQNTVGKLIEGKTSEQIAQLRFADIACGSGSFLIGAFEYLLDYHAKYYNKFKAKAKDDGCIEKDGIMVLSIKQKQKILVNNIYGVDIDNQAVEVTQLSLYLKLLEDETTATANEMQVLFHEKILPNMSKNIICGNSLIGTDILSNHLFAANEERKLNPMDFESTFPKVFKSKTEKEIVFTPDIGIDEVQETNLNLFNEPIKLYKKTIKGGFDAIVGNPPYIFTRDKGINEIEKSFYYSNYNFQSPQLNTFGLFVEKAFTILKENASLGYIIPNNWLSIDSFSILRKFIIKKTGNICIVNILDRVFQDANVDTCILIFEKKESNILSVSEMKNEKIIYSKKINTNIISPPQYIFQINLLKNTNNFNLLNKIENDSKPLSHYATVSTGVKVYQTGKGVPKQTDFEKKNRVFHSRNPKNKSYQKYLEGINVCRYYLGWSGEYLSYGDWIAEPRKSVPFIGDRILVRQIPSKYPYMVNAIFTSDAFINDINSMVVFNPVVVNLKFLLGCINSKLISFWFDNKFDKMQRKIFPQFKVKELSVFPIPKIDFLIKTEKDKHDKMVSIVEQMLQAKKQLQSAKIDKDITHFQLRCSTLDMQIDKLVYELYGLTKEEIEIVEGK